MKNPILIALLTSAALLLSACARPAPSSDGGAAETTVTEAVPSESTEPETADIPSPSPAPENTPEPEPEGKLVHRLTEARWVSGDDLVVGRSRHIYEYDDDSPYPSIIRYRFLDTDGQEYETVYKNTYNNDLKLLTKVILQSDGTETAWVAYNYDDEGHLIGGITHEELGISTFSNILDDEGRILTQITEFADFDGTVRVESHYTYDGNTEYISSDNGTETHVVLDGNGRPISFSNNSPYSNCGDYIYYGDAYVLIRSEYSSFLIGNIDEINLGGTADPTSNIAHDEYGYPTRIWDGSYWLELTYEDVYDTTTQTEPMPTPEPTAAPEASNSSPIAAYTAVLRTYFDDMHLDTDGYWELVDAQWEASMNDEADLETDVILSMLGYFFRYNEPIRCGLYDFDVNGVDELVIIAGSEQIACRAVYTFDGQAAHHLFPSALSERSYLNVYPGGGFVFGGSTGAGSGISTVARIAGDGYTLEILADAVYDDMLYGDMEPVYSPGSLTEEELAALYPGEAVPIEQLDGIQYIGVADMLAELGG